jgi:glycosyltransferase involved in cell wall biosynthesis
MSSAAAMDSTGLDNGIDSVYFLILGDLHEELESNRWHYARRWARHVPVTLLQPRQRLPRRRDARAVAAIDNCEVLPVMQTGEATAYPLRGLVQAAQVMEHMAKRGHSRPLLWCYNPLLAALYAAVPAVARVYHASENYFDFEQLPDFYHREFEAALRVSDLVIAVSSGVADGIRSRVPEARLEVVTNGCDVSHYQPTGSTNATIAAARDGFERVAVFAGNINSRVDFELVEQAAASNDSTLIVLAGPVSSLDSQDAESWGRVRGLKNVRHLERMAPTELAALYRSSDLGFIPYRRENWIVRNGFPLKTLEMAATGLPVVASEMKPIVGLASAIAVAEDDEQFLQSFASLSRSTITNEERLELLEVATANDYDRKFEHVVASVAGSRPADRGVHTRLDDLMLNLGYEPWRASCTRIFDRVTAFPVLAFAFVYAKLAAILPTRVRQLVPGRLRDKFATFAATEWHRRDA